MGKVIDLFIYLFYNFFFIRSPCHQAMLSARWPATLMVRSEGGPGVDRQRTEPPAKKKKGQRAAQGWTVNAQKPLPKKLKNGPGVNIGSARTPRPKTKIW